jgi:hypothetical protein
MIVALLGLIPLLAFSAWVFYRFTPSAIEGDVQRYNGMAVLVGALLCVGWSVRTSMGDVHKITMGDVHKIIKPFLFSLPIISSTYASPGSH